MARGNKRKKRATEPLLFAGQLIDRTLTLSEIAQGQVARVKELDPEHGALRRKTRGPERTREELSRFVALHHEITHAAINGIVFAAMALESCLYSMIFQLRPDAVSRVLNNLRLRSLDRWTLLLWRLTGEILSEDDDLYIALKRLITARNSIVHSKPTVITHESVERLKRFDPVVESKHALETMIKFERYVHKFRINLAHTLLGIGP